MVSVRNIVKKKLRRLNLNEECVKYIAEAVQYCINNKIHPIDVCLNKNVYPNLTKKYNKSFYAIETHIRRSVRKTYSSTNTFMWEEELNYRGRPTVRRLIMLLLEQFDY